MSLTKRGSLRSGTALQSDALTGPEDRTMQITNVEEYQKAAQRARELADKPEGTEGATELHDLIEAITRWEALQDDAPTQPD